jgi:phosphoribosylpyrophosphate synthetase
VHGVREIHLAVSHMKFRKEFLPRLLKAHKEWGLKTLHITDTIPLIPPVRKLKFVTIHRLARRFAATINHMHYDQSVSTLFRERESYEDGVTTKPRRPGRKRRRS